MLELAKYPYFSIDTETTGLHYPQDHAFCFSITVPDGVYWWTEYYDLRQDRGLGKKLAAQTRHYRGRIIAHHASFDYRMLLSAGIETPLELWDDTVTRACLIDEHLNSYALDDLAQQYLGMEKEQSIYEELAALFGGPATRKAQMPNISKAPAGIVQPYVDHDSLLTLALWEWQEEEIERQGIRKIVDFERKVMPSVIRAACRGINVDLDYTEEAADKLTPIIKREQKKLDRMAGKPFNVNSSPQVKELFDPQIKGNDFVIDGVRLGKTPKGTPSIRSEVLHELAEGGNEIAGLITNLRSLIKTRDTFLRGHVLGHAINSKVYPNINQNKGEDGGTGTGRLSYQEPAMQQIPNRNKKIAAIVKPCFLPPPGMRWLDADESSFEVRTFAHLINNAEVNQIFEQDPETDFHQMVADMTGLPRNAQRSGGPYAKQLNLSMIFNSGNGEIANKMGLPWHWESFTPRGSNQVITYKKPGPEAIRVINNYHKRLPGIRELAEVSQQMALKQGYVETEFGRRLRFPNGHKAYKASGLRIQATAADLNKENWVLIEEALGPDGHLILNTHDSYGMAVPEDWGPVYQRVKESLDRPGRLRVPLILELSGVGDNWWAALQGDI